MSKKSKKDVYVVFKEGEIPRIVKGAVPFSGDFLKNPQLPEGVPPHMWLLQDGKIGVSDKPVSLVTSKKAYKKAKKEDKSNETIVRVVKQPKPKKLDKFKLCVIMGLAVLASSEIYFNLDQIIQLIERIK
jgi:hypothetical protein